MFNKLLVVMVPVLLWNIGGLEQIGAEPSQAWVARYNSLRKSYDYAEAIAVDSDGNVYVTGYSDGYATLYDYVTIKYDQSGNRIWLARYNGPNNGDDYARDIAVDSAGNVYVTGTSSGSSHDSFDYATIKYNSAGQEQWVARYNGPGNGNDYAEDIAVDSAGNVYVTGNSTGNGTFEDYTTIRYSSDGQEQWVARYNGSGNGDDYAYSLVTDDTGNIYITGASYSPGSGFDYVTVAYNSAGQEQWIGRYNGPGNGDDYAKAIAVDSGGNVYITGYSIGSDTFADYATIKYAIDQSSINQAPVLNSIGDKTVTEGAPLSFTISATDPDGDPLTYSASNLPRGASFNGRIFSWTPTYTQAGTYSGVHFEVSDGKSTASEDITISVANSDRAEPAIDSIINQQSFQRGDVLIWDIALDGTEKVDAYLAVVLPSGDFVCLENLEGNTGGLNQAVPIVSNWTIVPGTYRIISYTFSGEEPKGVYQLYIIFLKPGSGPLDKDSLLAYSRSVFTYE